MHQQAQKCTKKDSDEEDYYQANVNVNHAQFLKAGFANERDACDTDLVVHTVCEYQEK